MLSQLGLGVLSRQGFEDALQSPSIQTIAQSALNFLKEKGLARNVAAFDWAILLVIGEERLTYEEHGAVVQLLCAPWMLASQT